MAESNKLFLGDKLGLPFYSLWGHGGGLVAQNGSIKKGQQANPNKAML